jgi:hypothetical protein
VRVKGKGQKTKPRNSRINDKGSQSADTRAHRQRTVIAVGEQETTYFDRIDIGLAGIFGPAELKVKADRGTSMLRDRALS